MQHPVLPLVRDRPRQFQQATFPNDLYPTCNERHIKMSFIYSIERPVSLAYNMAQIELDNRKRFRVIIAVNDAVGRTLSLYDETVTLRGIRKMMKPVVKVQPNNVLANMIRPASWTVIIEQDDYIKVRTVPFKKPTLR